MRAGDSNYQVVLSCGGDIRTHGGKTKHCKLNVLVHMFTEAAELCFWRTAGFSCR